MAAAGKKKKKLSFCEIHGKKHALSSGLCTHPKCVGKVVGLHCKRSKWVKKFWRQILELGAEQDCVGWIVMRLLHEEQTQGKKPTINSTWLFYNLRKYLWTEHKKGDVPIWKCMPSAKNQLEKNQSYLEGIFAKFDGAQEVVEGIINAAMHYDSSGSTWEQEDIETIYGVYEMKEYIKEVYGEVWLLYLMDQVELNDVRKLTGLKVQEIYEQKRKMVAHLSHEFKKDFQD
mgnify:CR=1 FL=1